MEKNKYFVYRKEDKKETAAPLIINALILCL